MAKEGPILTSSPAMGFRIRCEHLGIKTFGTLFHILHCSNNYNVTVDMLFGIYSQLEKELDNG